MCTLLFAWQVDPSRMLVVAANRDEFYGRATAAAAFWADAPQLLAGRDLQAGGTLWYLSNRAGPARALGPGVYGVSNAALDAPWPKVLRGRERLAALVSGGADTPALLDLLEDRSPAADAELPDTGVGRTMERLLSPLFIASPAYGTCSSTAVVVHRDGALEFHERTQNPQAPTGPGEVVYAVAAPPAS